MIPYARHWIDEDDIAAVVDVLRSDWLTTGPKVEEFEHALAQVAGTRRAVTFSSGTAALHGMMHALVIGPGDEVLVPAMTFAASANCVVYQGGTPVFVDVEPDTLLLDAADAAGKITPRTRAILAVDYAGQPCDYQALHALARRHNLALVADACHSLGGEYRGRTVGSLALMSAFSFHPVKHVAAGEGGAVTTDDARFAERLLRFRNHGIASDHRERDRSGKWRYEMVDLGFNYRLSDIHCALGLSQLAKLRTGIVRRREIAALYDEEFAAQRDVSPLTVRPDLKHAYHLYVVRVPNREHLFHALRAAGIGVNVHYIPVHLHPFYQERFGTGRGLCPVVEAASEDILSLPLSPRMSNREVAEVVRAVVEPTAGSKVRHLSNLARKSDSGSRRSSLII
jgi:perosamine synthetase